jgi:hypothetical protein
MHTGTESGETCSVSSLFSRRNETKESIRLFGIVARFYESSEIVFGHMKSGRMVSDPKKQNNFPAHFKH